MHKSFLENFFFNRIQVLYYLLNKGKYIEVSWGYKWHHTALTELLLFCCIKSKFPLIIPDSYSPLSPLTSDLLAEREVYT